MRRRSLLCFLLLSLSLLMGCSGDGPSPAGYTSPSVNPTLSPPSLEDYDGWWYVDEGTYEGFPLIRIFHLDAQSARWTAYSDTGFTASEGDAWVNDSGQLVLDLDVWGKVSMAHQDEDTLLLEDGMTFHRGEPTDNPDYGTFAGNWYESGDLSGNWYALYDDGSYEYYIPFYSADEPSESGTYSFDTITRYIGDSPGFEILDLTLDDGSGFPNDLYLADNGAALLSDGLEDNFYVREDRIGTPEGKEATVFCTLVLKNWQSGDSRHFLFFYENGCFHLSAPDSEGVIEPFKQGTWALNDNVITLYWKNSVKEDVALQNDGEIYVPSQEETFTSW